MQHKNIVIIGAGDGVSGAFARKAHAQGANILLAARNIKKLAGLAKDTKALTLSVDATSQVDVARLFAWADEALGSVDLLLYNPSMRLSVPLLELDPDKALDAIKVNAWGALVAAQEATRRMINQGYGTILLTGATASIKGGAHSAAFAMGKFALRGLAQSIARELAPKNIHVAHFILDGQVGISDDDHLLHPDAVAQTYWNIATQPRSAWTWEIELRPYVEKF